MAAMTPENIPSLNIVLIGKTGNGKSATGNTILNRNAFSISASSNSCTQDCRLESTRFENVILNVIDTPGLKDTKVKPKKIFKRLSTAMSLSVNGFNAFILVLRYGVRFTDEELNTYETVKSFFSPDFLKVCVLVFTCGDHFESENEDETFEHWLESQDGPIQNVIKDCSKKVLLFNNKRQSPTFEEQRTQTLKKLVDMIKQNGMVYTDQNFEKAKSERDKLAVASKLPQLEAKYQQKLSLLSEKLNKAIEKEKALSQNKASKSEITQEENISSKEEINRCIQLASDIKADIDEDDKGSNHLKHFKLSVNEILNHLNIMEKKTKNRGDVLKKLDELTQLLKTPPSIKDLVLRGVATVATAVGGTVFTVITLPCPILAVSIAATTVALTALNTGTFSVNAHTIKMYKGKVKKLRNEIHEMELRI